MSASGEGCALCGRERELQPRFGLHICGECNAGDFSAGLDPDWGASLRSERSEEVDPKHYESALVCVLSIELELPRPSPCVMRLVPERGGHKLVKLFKKELQVGDKAFDDAVYIADEHREATTDLLGREGVREAILVLLHEQFARLEFQAERLRFQARHRGAFDPQALGMMTAMVALGRHLDRLAVA